MHMMLVTAPPSSSSSSSSAIRRKKKKRRKPSLLLSASLGFSRLLFGRDFWCPPEHTLYTSHEPESLQWTDYFGVFRPVRSPSHTGLYTSVMKTLWKDSFWLHDFTVTDTNLQVTCSSRSELKSANNKQTNKNRCKDHSKLCGELNKWVLFGILGLGVNYLFLILILIFNYPCC